MLPLLLILMCMVVSGKNPSIGAAKLGSLAHSAALQAQNLAHGQEVASHYAAFSVKNDLAQTAHNAASAAQVALAGKKLAIQSLQKRLKKAEEDLKTEQEQYEFLKGVAGVFSKAADDARSQVETLRGILEDTCKSIDKSVHVSFGVGFH